MSAVKFLLSYEGDEVDPFFLPMGVFDTPDLAMKFLGTDRVWHVTRNGEYDQWTSYQQVGDGNREFNLPATVYEYNVCPVAYNPQKVDGS